MSIEMAAMMVMLEKIEANQREVILCLEKNRVLLEKIHHNQP